MTRKEYTNRDLMIEKRLTRLEESLEEIKTNHLAHMDEKIDDYNTKTNNKIDKILWFLITSFFGLASGLAFIIFKMQ